MDNQSNNNTTNSLSDIFTSNAGVATNQVSSNEAVIQTNNEVNQSSQNQEMINTQTPIGINQQSVMPNQVSSNETVIQTNNAVNQNVYNETDNGVFLKSFIGANYDKLTKRNFNFSAFFFTSFYMFYRKMLWQGLVLYCAMFVVSNFLGTFGRALSLIFSLVVGLAFNKFYVKYATDEVEKIKQENQNGNSSTISLACFSKGGTSVGNIFLGLFIAAIISTIFGMIFPSKAAITM